MKNKYIVATRPSLLAYTQTCMTVDLLRSRHPECEFEIVKIATHGDNVTNKPLTEFGGTGVFVKELETAIIEGKAHFAVHSLKDVPSVQPQGLCLAAFPKREDVRDVLIVRDGLTLADLPDSCKIGTGSPRRIVQIGKLKSDIHFADLRGNIDTRLKKLETGEYDAIVLAAAGLKRLGKEIKEEHFLSTETCLPAIGQGAIAIECLSHDKDCISMLKSINHKPTQIAIEAERSFMKTIGGGCKFPLGAYGIVDGEEIHLDVMLGNHLTGDIIRLKRTGSTYHSVQLGHEMALELIEIANERGIEILR